VSKSKYAPANIRHASLMSDLELTFAKVAAQSEVRSTNVPPFMSVDRISHCPRNFEL
jgi:hypothetical protein